MRYGSFLLIGAVLLVSVSLTGFIFLREEPQPESKVERSVFSRENPPQATIPPRAVEEKSDREVPRPEIVRKRVQVPPIPKSAILPPPATAIPLSPMIQQPRIEQLGTSTPMVPSVIPPSPTAEPQVIVEPPPLPPLDERALLAAVVKIECPSEDRRGKYVGSGFVLPKGIVITAAHVIKDAGSNTCQVIFPNKDRAPSHYLSGVTEDLAEVKRRHDEEGIDVAVIFLPALSAYPEGAAVFQDGYPYIPYPICDQPRMLKDKLLHFGYPSNFVNQSYLSKLDGEAVAYADIQGIKEQLSEDQTFTFKTPVFGYTGDQSQLHPYMVSRVPSFYGDSGGLAFNATKQCILGPHRGGTIGGAAGENFSVFPLLGWQGATRILPR